jgi:hypothetical protein
MPPPGHYIPTIPIKPNIPEYYTPGLTFSLNSGLSTEGNAWYQNWGGWGYLTMGLLQPITLTNHSYGTLGQQGQYMNTGIHWD